MTVAGGVYVDYIPPTYNWRSIITDSSQDIDTGMVPMRNQDVNA